MPHVAGARRMATNVRFGQPGRNARHPQDPAWQADLFPFTYAVLEDPLTGRRDGLLLRCRAERHLPARHADRQRARVVGVPRLAAGDRPGGQPPRPAAGRARLHDRRHAAFRGARRRACGARRPMALPVNPMHAGAPMRALLAAHGGLDRATACEPPASRVPMRAHGTLVEAADARAGRHPRPALYRRSTPAPPASDQSRDAAARDRAAIRSSCRGPIADGMAVAGIRMLPLAVPRASYTGWNPRAEGFGAGTLFPLQGAVVPFAADARRARGGAAIRGCRWTSATRTPAPTSPRCAQRRRGWWPSGCCCRRTPTARRRWPRRGGWRS